MGGEGQPTPLYMLTYGREAGRPAAGRPGGAGRPAAGPRDLSAIIFRVFFCGKAPAARLPGGQVPAGPGRPAAGRPGIFL